MRPGSVIPAVVSDAVVDKENITTQVQLGGEYPPFLAAYDEYRRPLLLHLLDVKASHWEPRMRLMAAQAAARLAPLDAAWAEETMVPTLVRRSISSDLKERHGAVHMLAEVLVGLVRDVHGGDGTALPGELRKAVANVVPNIEKMRLYRGRGGEVMRGAACRLLEAILRETSRLGREAVASAAAGDVDPLSRCD